jgi:carbon monoxide dehydrogenase subunit G
VARIQKSIAIAADPADIESYSRFADSWPEWFPGVEAVQVDGTYPAVSSVARVSFRAAGTLFDLTLTVDEYLPGQGVTYQLSGMAQGTLSFAVAGDGADQRVDADVAYELAGGVLGQIADRALVESMVDDHVEAALRNMKARLEG